MSASFLRQAVPAIVLAALAGCAGRPVTESSACPVAARYVEAANSGNAQAIEPLLADAVTAVFLSGRGAELSRLEGKADVLEAVRTYTAQCPSCRSSVRCLHATERAVYAIEDVEFTDQDGVTQRQSAPLVIELDDGDVIAIIYYPSTDFVPRD